MFIIEYYVDRLFLAVGWSLEAVWDIFRFLLSLVFLA